MYNEDQEGNDACVPEEEEEEDEREREPILSTGQERAMANKTKAPTRAQRSASMPSQWLQVAVLLLMTVSVASASRNLRQEGPPSWVCDRIGDRPTNGGWCPCWVDGVCKGPSSSERADIEASLKERATSESGLIECSKGNTIEACVNMTASVDLSLLGRPGAVDDPERMNADVRAVYSAVADDMLIIENGLYTVIMHGSNETDRRLQECQCTGRWVHTYKRESNGNIYKSRTEVRTPTGTIHKKKWGKEPVTLPCMNNNDYHVWVGEGEGTVTKLMKQHIFDYGLGEVTYKRDQRGRWTRKLGVRCVNTNGYVVGWV